MKKLSSLIPVAIMFSILAFLLVYMCLPQKQSAAVYIVDLYFLRTRGLYVAVLGGILLVAFYHLTLFVFRRREMVYLYFTIWCLLCVVQFSLVTGGLNDIFHWIPQGVFLLKSIDAVSFLYHNMITVVGLSVFSRSLLIEHRKALIIYVVVGIAYICFVPTSISFYKPVFFTVIFAVALLITTVALRSRTLRENRWTWLYFISFIFFILIALANNVFITGVFFMPGLLASLFMILSQSVLLSKNYSDAFQFVEETNQNLEQIVDERTNTLQSTNNAMKELMSNISHDLKTPLAVMSINLETLSALAVTQADAEYQRHVRTAYQKNRDLQRLIQNLFEVSRIETSRSCYSPEWLSLLHILAQAKEKYDTYLEDNGILLEINIEEDIEISTDPQKVWSVFDNIIYNAARYTGSGGSVTITAKNMKYYVTVIITDTGCGIEAEHMPKIFDRFYRVSPSRSTNDGESGLGLYIVRSVMEGCGGSVEAASTPGHGTSIILTFPART